MHGSEKVLVSSAAAPDLGWSQVSETVLMLNLAAAQISMAMHAGDDSVGALTTSFTGMVGDVNDIADAATSEQAELLPEDIRASVLDHCASVQSGIQQSIVAFQFYDRRSQRLDHVRFALESLAGLVAEKSRLYNPDEWGVLQQGIRSKYSMREEQDMFEALLNGGTTEEALDIVRKRVHAGDIDAIELF